MNTAANRLANPKAGGDAPGPGQSVALFWRITAALRARPEWILSPLLLVLLLAAWELLVTTKPDLEFLISRPEPVLDALMGAFVSAGMWRDIWTTSSEALVGFGAAFTLAIAVGLGVILVPKLEELLMPYLIASYAVPVLITAPLFVMWFGFGFTSKAVIAAFTSFFPMLVNILNGFRHANAEQVEMLTSFKATQRQIFRFSRLPNAIPYVFLAMDVGLIFAMMGAIVGEFSGAKEGLGYRVLHNSYSFEIADLFVTLLTLAALGFLAHALVMFIQRKVAFWTTPQHDLTV